MADPVFLTYESGCALHRWGLSVHGGEGIPDSGKLDGALNGAINTWYYGKQDHFEVAAAYAYGISQGHVFSHGNKTAGAFAALTYLELNGIHTGGMPSGVFYDAISGLGASVSKAGLEDIFRYHLS